MTDHETTNGEKASILAQAREDYKACSVPTRTGTTENMDVVQWESGVMPASH